MVETNAEVWLERQTPLVSMSLPPEFYSIQVSIYSLETIYREPISCQVAVCVSAGMDANMFH